MTLRPVLAPGADVVRRDARTLLVGTRPGVVVHDHPGLVPLLRLLDGRTVESVAALAADRVPSFDRDVVQTLHELVARGALVDAQPPPARLTVRVAGWRGSDAVTGVVHSAVQHLGLRDSPDASMLVLVSAGEPPRRWVREAAERATVLPVVLESRRARVGPLVVLGRTPCLDCHDAERTLWDPGWPAVVSQLGRPLVAAPTAAPATSLLWRTAAAVADEVQAVAEGRESLTSGAVLELDRAAVSRHPVVFGAGCRCLPWSG